MAATFVPNASDHGLSEQVTALSAARQAVEFLVAEEILGLRGRELEDADSVELAKWCVAQQTNTQVRHASSPDPDVVQESRGRQSVTYAKYRGGRVPVHTLAKMTADSLKGTGRVMSSTTAMESRF